jgi:hypothetical protein
MRKLKIIPSQIFIFVGLLSTMVTGAIYAEENTSCTTSCAADLKECDKKANSSSYNEAHSLIFESSASRDVSAQSRNTGVAEYEMSLSKNDEIQRRRAERYQVCGNENANCLKQCSPKSTSPKISVILK